MNIYVSNLSFNIQDEDLKEFFTEYGEVSSAKVITDKFTGKSRGFGFVEMQNDEDGKEAIEHLNDISLGKKPLVVKQADDRAPSKPGPSGGGYRGGGGNSGGYNKRNDNRGNRY